MDLGRKHGKEIPSPLILWHAVFAMVPNYYLYLLRVFFLQTVPAHVVDFIARCAGRKPMLVKAYTKIGKFADIIGHFTTNEWYFANDNVRELWGRLRPGDRRLFPFSMAAFDWNDYFPYYLRGTRVYLLKDPMETVPEGKKKIRRLRYYHYTLVTFLSLIAIKMTTSLFALVFFKS